MQRKSVSLKLSNKHIERGVKLKIEICLKALLEEKNISQRELSRKLDITFTTINKMCNNTLQHFPLQTLANICEELDVEISDVLRLKKETT